jgi:hypothetical protein
MSHAGLKILEIGQFCLFKRTLPEQTTLIFTGDDFGAVEDLSYRIFTIGLVPGLFRALARGQWDIVVCYPPTRELWDRKHGLLRALRGLARRVRHFRTLGTYTLRSSVGSPVVLLDFHDESTISRDSFALLDRSILYFKRELPVDLAKALRDAAPDLRTGRDVVSSAFFKRNQHKLRPVSPAIPKHTVQLALETKAEKTVDVFFAGLINSTVRTTGLTQLKLLQSEGYSVDACEGGLSKAAYLARCARAWLTWSPEGYGWNCFREYEASLCLSVPVKNQPGVLRYQPLQDHVHALYYPAEENGLHDTIVKALAHKPALEAISRAARAHVLGHHTHARVVDYILDTALDVIGAGEHALHG